MYIKWNIVNRYPNATLHTTSLVLVYDNPWKSMTVYDSPWQSMIVHSPWQSMIVHVSQIATVSHFWLVWIFCIFLSSICIFWDFKKNLVGNQLYFCPIKSILKQYLGHLLPGYTNWMQTLHIDPKGCWRPKFSSSLF